MRLLLLLLLVPTAALALTPAGEAGRAVMERAQCTRCHPVSDGAVPGIPAAVRDFHCVDCHTWILGTKGKPSEIAAMRKDFPDWDRYLENIVHFTRLPDLGSLRRKVRVKFVRTFLDGPFDLRPHLDESMIPLRLTAAEKDQVVAYLSELAGPDAATDLPADPPAPTAEQIQAGRERFAQRACTACHVVGDAPVTPGLTAATYQALTMPGRLAPDLRHVRDRIPRPVLVRYIQDPQAVDPHSAMPKMPVFGDDADRIADFLLAAELPDRAGAAAVAPEVPLLDRPVTYDEVHDKVLGRICVHCHMHPESNNGDGGAGNTGGLGFAGVKLDLETYEGVKRGLVRDGKRVDVLAPEAPGQPPLLLAALLRRHVEGGRDFRHPLTPGGPLAPPTSAARPGMPLGLPPLALDQLSLVKTWIAQGAPGR
ncbi:MAG: hypothetical protein H6706_27885 [Myxococcales bacterium]|nr:hypothetical protein [Myxococcales bacterium]